MPITRRQFIKRTAGAVSVSFMVPKVLLGAGNPSSESPSATSTNKKLVVIQLAGGNDGLNTFIPYTDARYQSLRPTLGFQESELTATAINSQFALHPAMTDMKALYDSGKVAIVPGVGYPNPNLSHFTSMDIWHTADPTLTRSEGWLGSYGDLALLQATGIPGMSVDSEQPKTLYSTKMVFPNAAPSSQGFASYQFRSDAKYPGDASNQRQTWDTVYGRSFDPTTYIGQVTAVGLNAVQGADTIRTSVTAYSPAVTYGTDNLGVSLKMIAELITTIPEIQLLYVELGGFDHHSKEIGDTADPANRLIGQHATLLGDFSAGVKNFYDDMVAHGLADQILIMQWSEFGRRPNENASLGTDHGTAAPVFVVGNAIAGGIHGDQPSLASTSLDSAGNMKSLIDFRSIYGTILDKWLGSNSQEVLGGSFPDAGFLG